MKTEMNQKIKPNIILVDDHHILRQKLKKYIETEEIGIVVGEAANENELVELLCVNNPDIMLIDLEMPQFKSLEATKKALQLLPSLKVVVFTMFDDDYFYMKMLESGVKGFILKTCDILEIKNVIQAVMKGERYFSVNKFEKGKSESLLKVRTDIREQSIHLSPSNINIYNAIPWF